MKKIKNLEKVSSDKGKHGCYQAKKGKGKARLAAMTQEERNKKIESVVNNIIRKKQVNLILLF